MGKKVTFSFSIELEDSKVVETFNFENLGIEEGMDDEVEKKIFLIA